MKRVAILGSTGSIGINTLKVIESHPKRFKVAGLSSFSNVELLKKQIKRFRPSMATVVEPSKADGLKAFVKRRGLKLFSTLEGLNIIASSKEVDIVVIAISGASAVYPLLASISAGKHICLANKESIVTAGDIIMKAQAKSGSRIIPVDSEHNAIFQCINSSSISKVNKIYLTGSGGSLRNVPRRKLAKVSVKEVLRHPKWKMGKKITVDSATLMNKGLEMIEASHLFNIPMDKIELLIHPEATIHSMVEFIDGTILAHLGATDMRLPIQHALTYPERIASPLPMLDFSRIEAFTFQRPDTAKYPCLTLAMAAAKLGKTYPAVLNAANEEAVKAFLERRIGFTKIAKVIEKVLLRHTPSPNLALNDIFQADNWAREEARSIC
ncbi:MAG: 1-deoxy-D-xylulose-5-phosphate reductoisomerase [Candidatus Omnitrophica bacterium]|nr:1-deoxy-D-xylulose-5-phosphate reductoisomerase [Candidatus Omnitrophota bacterium]